MQNLILKVREGSIVFEKLGILFEHLKTLTSFNYPTVYYFFNETLYTISTYQCLQKGAWNFLFCLDL